MMHSGTGELLVKLNSSRRCGCENVHRQTSELQYEPRQLRLMEDLVAFYPRRQSMCFILPTPIRTYRMHVFGKLLRPLFQKGVPKQYIL